MTLYELLGLCCGSLAGMLMTALIVASVSLLEFGDTIMRILRSWKRSSDVRTPPAAAKPKRRRRKAKAEPEHVESGSVSVTFEPAPGVSVTEVKA